MKVIAVIGQKGGTGKTTLTQVLTVAAEQAGLITAGIDLDPQVSLCKWSDTRQQDAPLVIDTQPARLPHTLDTARKQGVGLVVIDTAGRAEHASLAAAKAADLVIIPLQPTVADLQTLEAARDVIKLAGNPPSLAVLTRIKATGERHAESMEWLKAQNMPTCPVMLGDRVAYQDAYAVGQTPMEFEPRGKAAEECKLLYEFVSKLIN